ncbi:malate dehydrogenase (quinone) [Periweissella fabaria]|uniref:Probable malate:quinone oxidoreductase n=1 Tax=Periweissella fabaria TaxID=546157 RepID=A0ABN8BGI1_9LACO|nr:malate dehydrogenase (quinone) [Periweissella fabaria]MCM0597391.1 malate dehydrogenase (quinone) [Periweissella fabaria]CAH0416103.1 putative malate:quinone oxidoreductase 1 [Periweissella fabaria]
MCNDKQAVDVLLIGAGIMSATLGTLLKKLDPTLNVRILEKMAQPAQESSNAWNNAGTGHSALCELNYTAQNSDGSISIDKALNINEQFQLSRQFWTYLVEQGEIQNPADFIRAIPHMSMVQGSENTEFLQRRVAALTKSPLFQGMEYTDDPVILQKWMPLVMAGRKPDTKIGATKINSGTDVNFGVLTRLLFANLQQLGVEIDYGHTVKDICRKNDKLWEVKVINERGQVEQLTTKFLFIGAGGGALPLLQKTGIPEAKHIGGFPISGLFLVCKNSTIANRHHGKVYGKAAVGAPPMSVPHLDTRFIDGQKALLFGPFAGFSPKFLKTGSSWDLINSVKPDNLVTMLASGVKNVRLVQYLLKELTLTKAQRMAELRQFMPEAQSDDWELIVAGQRVQVIKDTDKGKGILQFGTEIITGAEGSVAALLGASPGASTAVSIMLKLINTCFADRMAEWTPKILTMIPSYGTKLNDDATLFAEIQAHTTKTLQLGS